MTFFEEWETRYINGIATITHLERLEKIGKLTHDEVLKILSKKALKDKR